jgi:aryl-alcohol dehydrogenase-like predicted oxidoreductase
MAGSADKKAAVEYNWLAPNAGIKVSNICFGTMTFGQTSFLKYDLPGNTDEAGSHALLDRFYELGGNFLDTANLYTAGDSERIIGSWLKKQNKDRASVVLATKVRFNANPQDRSALNKTGLSRSSILSNLEDSLKRLQTDYIDLYYSHGWDSGVKLEETLRTFNDVVRSGKVRYVGVSNVRGAQLQKIVDYNKFLGFDQSVVLQAEYNLMEHHCDWELIPTCQEEGLSLVPYSPLKGGLLTGKFKRDTKDVQTSLAGTRLAWTAEKPKERTFSVAPHTESFKDNENYWKLMDVMETVGKAHGKSQSQVAPRW